MTIQRLTFEDRGQDFLWWEIQPETGRIVGCGPFQASIWASGKTSVDMATVSIGQRPTYFSPHTGEDGKRLNYEISGIAPAPKSGGVASMSELTANLVDQVQAAVNAVDWSYGSQSSAGFNLALQLEIEHGARIVPGRDPMTMSLAGVRASSTGGYPGMFGNWIAAARRRLAQREANHG